MTAKLRIRTKGIEIEWEGEVAFLKSELPDLIKSIIEAIGAADLSDEDDESAQEGQAEVGTFTTAALAAKIKPSTAAELFKVALGKLQLSDKIEPASRAQIHDEMKKASKFYKPSMRGNLGKTIETLLGSGEINEPSTGNFALSHGAQQLLETVVTTPKV